MLGNPDSCFCFGWSAAGMWHTPVLLVLQIAHPWQENWVTLSVITVSGIPCQANDLSVKTCCFCMRGICFPVTQTEVRHHEVSVLVNMQIPNLAQRQKGSQCIIVLLCCQAWILLQKFPRLMLVNPNATSFLYVCTEFCINIHHQRDSAFALECIRIHIFKFLGASYKAPLCCPLFTAKFSCTYSSPLFIHRHPILSVLGPGIPHTGVILP